MAISSGVSLTDEYLFCINHAATHKCIIVNHSKIFIINIVSVHHSLTTELLWVNSYVMLCNGKYVM